MKKSIIIILPFFAMAVLADIVLFTQSPNKDGITWVSGGGNNLIAQFGEAGGTTASGGIITTNGTKLVHTFTNDGTFTVSDGSLNCIILIVAGGGSGGSHWGGGGGAGGVRLITQDVSSAISIVVGIGGAQAPNESRGISGSNSSFDATTSTGGGGGGRYTENGFNGGSGGGGGLQSSFGTGISGQGFNGGSPSAAPTYGGMGGGGGVSELGHNGNGAGGWDNLIAGAGGEGFESNISGASHTYGSGGGGTGNNNQTTTQPTGGEGGTGGGDGIRMNNVPEYGRMWSDASYYGGGGGGAQHYTQGGNGGKGYQGVVIVTYEIP